MTADHGNADLMADEQGNPITAHSCNRVPVIYIGSRKNKLRDNGILADLAPSILDLMDIQKPAEMSGETLFID